MRLALLGSILFLPQLCLASVYISEVAWMGSSDSPNHEWIELHNPGSATNVDGWILHDENSLTIELTGTMPAGQYVVLERTSDASASGAAFLLYTGALGNGGATLVLRDAQGNVVDQVAGGSNWENVGGDNATKDTAQRSDGLWRTAPGTPGRPATTAGQTTTATDSTGIETSSSLKATAQRTSVPERQLTLPGITLQLELVASAYTHAGQPTRFTVEPSGVGDTIADSLLYTWSMGNGEQVTGKEIDYTFAYPGEYVVVVAGEYKRQTQFARHTISVSPVQLQLTKASDGGTVVIHNLGDREIDIGGYRLVGQREHTFPTHTIILPRAQVRVPVPIADRYGRNVALHDQTGLVVAAYVPGAMLASVGAAPNFGSPATVSQVVVQPGHAVAATPPPTPPSNSNFGFVTDEPPQTTPSVTPPVVSHPPTLTTQPAADTPNSTPSMVANWPVYALVALLFFGTLGVYLVPVKRDDPPWV